MPYLSKEDLITHLHAEILEEISRADDTIIERAINTGVGLAKSHLNRYDKVAMFGNPTADPAVEPTFEDDYLNSLVKDLVCFQLVKLCNPSVNYEVFEKSYDDAVAEFVKIKKGLADPEWPLAFNDPETPIDEGGNVEYSSNARRKNHY